jgi:uncharacterized protein YegJ (DUF2314 family)
LQAVRHDNEVGRPDIQHAMKHILHVTVISLGVLLSLVTGCSKRDKVINIAEDDPDMVAAIAKARDSLPQFWDAFDKRQRGETEFSLKVKITDKRGTEHFWLTEIERRDGQVHGTIDNDPDIVRNVKRGARILIPEADISDWFYMRDHKMIGNYTLRVLFKTMPAAEVKRYKQIMVDP